MDQQSHLIDLLMVLRQRWWIIALCMACCAVIVALWSHFQAPGFESTATVLIEQEHQGPLQKSDRTLADLSPDYYETHFELLKSRRVLVKAAEELKLLDRAEYLTSAGWLERALIGVHSKVDTNPATVPSAQSQAIGRERMQESWDLALGRFEQTIQIKPVRGTRLAKITVQSGDANFAADAANAIARAYIHLNEEVHAQKKERAREWFSSHLTDLRSKVEQSQEALNVYRVKYGVVQTGDHQTPSRQRLAELSSELVKLELRRAEAESRYQQIALLIPEKTKAEGIDWAKWGDHAEVLSSPLIQVLRAQEIKASTDVAELAEKYGSLHPKITRAEAELSQLRERIVEEVRKIYASLKHERDLASTREAAIRAAVDRQKRDAMQFDQYQAQQGILEREVKSAQQVYDLFLGEAKEASLASELIATNVVIADPASPPSKPSKPRKVANAILGLLGGLVFGLGMAFGLDHFDQSLKGPRDLAGYLPTIAFLGAIPRLRHLATEQALVLRGPHALPALEAVRSIRTSIMLSGMMPDHGALVITSSGPDEGKSTVAVNLALAMAQIEDSRVLLIDADLRNSHRGSFFQVKDDDSRGLGDFLDGDAELDEVIHHSGESNLWIIPRGKVTENPTELLSSRRMASLLEKCRAERYFAIIDTPPVSLFSDAVILGSQADGVMLIVGAGQADRESCQLAAQRIVQAGGRLLGVVLQKAVGPRLSHYSQYAQIQ